MKWINLQELVLIHELVINETGGIHGILNPGALESILLRPFTSLRGQEIFPTLWTKVAVLIHSLIVFHPFVDGNKRTAFVAADVCLKLNGHRIITSRDNEIFFWAIARGEKTIIEIATWLETHSETWEVIP